MKTKLILASAIATALSAPVWAQGTSPSTPSVQPTQSEQQPGYGGSTTPGAGSDVTGKPMSSSTSGSGTMQSTGQQSRASDLIGADVYNTQDEDIGEVDDLIVGNDGKISDVVISVGGFLGMGAKLVSVPYEEVQLGGENQDRLIYNATKEQLESQPEFKYEQAEFSRYGKEESLGTTPGTTPGTPTERQEETLPKTQ